MSGLYSYELLATAIGLSFEACFIFSAFLLLNQL